MARTINIFNKHNAGLTLVELILYMSIFSILVTGFLSASVYIQKIIQSYTYDYKAKACIYEQLSILQQYKGVLASKVPSITLDQEKHMQLVYTYPQQKIIKICDLIKFEELVYTTKEKPRTISEKSEVNIKFSFFDIRHKLISFTETLIVYKVAPLPLF